MTFAEIIAHFPDAKKNGSGYHCCCPAHEDRTPSLSIAEGAAGRTLITCHAGCTTESILSARGLKMADLFPPDPDGTRADAKPRIVATYDYTDAYGKLLFQVVRMDPKSFRQRRPDPDRAGDFIWNMQGVERALYRLPEVLAAVKAGETIYIVEGEKDADALTAIGLVATCNPGGAGKWMDSYTAALQGAASVVIVADKDKPGRDHAERVRAALDGKASNAAVVELPEWHGKPVKDAADFIAAGATVFDFAEACKLKNPLDLLPHEYARDYIDRAPPPIDPILDGVFECGDKVPIIGSPKSRKTFFISELSIRLASGHTEFLGWKIPKRRRVMYLQHEVKSAHYHRRIHFICRALGVNSKDIADNLLIYNLRGHKMPVDLIARAAKEHRAEVIVIDPLYIMLEGDENAACDMKPLLAAFGRLAEETGAAIVYVHHNGKGTAGDRDARDRGAGSNVLSRDMDAAVYLTDHKDDGLLVVETITRNFPPVAPFTVEWFDGKFDIVENVDAEVRTSKNRHSAAENGVKERVIEMALEHSSYSVREIAEKVGCGKSTAAKFYPKKGRS